MQKSAQECEKKELEHKRGLRVPFECNWEFSTLGIVGTHPGSFCRVPNKGVARYGTWKRIRKMGDKRSKGNKGVGSRGERAGLSGHFAQAALGKVSSINHNRCYHDLSYLSNTIIVLVFSELASFCSKDFASRRKQRDRAHWGREKKLEGRNEAWGGGSDWRYAPKIRITSESFRSFPATSPPTEANP